MSPQLWDSFIRCCCAIRPASFQVLLHLPKLERVDVLQRDDTLKQGLKQHVGRMSDVQRRRYGHLVSMLTEEDTHPDGDEALSSQPPIQETPAAAAGAEP